MSGHFERRYLDYSTEQLFDLVADVEKYPEFIPWILSCRILTRQENLVGVEMVVGIGALQARFNSQGVLHRPHAIDITSNDAPFASFHQRWQFSPDAQGRTVVACSYDFSLRSDVLDLISSPVLDQAMQTTIDAFERRARLVYGTRPAPIRGHVDE